MIAPCGRERSAEILAIFNHAIAHTTALYDLEPRTPAFMESWFDTKDRARIPVLGAIDADGSLAGFATYGAFRTFAGYRHTFEHSLYVRADRRGSGLGRALLAAIVDAARERGVRTLVGVIDAENTASLALHRASGFQSAGLLRSVGRKFGRWLDVEILQLTLPGPNDPDRAS